MSLSAWHKIFRRLLFAVSAFSIVWIFLTLWVEKRGPKRTWQSGGLASANTALIVYDPDPFYNLDEQVCLSFAQALADQGIKVNVSSVAAAQETTLDQFDFYVLCANTYNWRPDWAIRKFIKSRSFHGKPVIAITLGSGSTSSSQRELEKIIANSHGKILDSRSLWLLRPNDESRVQESNIKVAKSISYTWASEVATHLQSLP